VLVVVYTNVAILGGFVLSRRLPQLPGLSDAFWLFNVFSDYRVVNREMVVEAEVEGAWVPVPEAYFPYRLDEKTTRLFARRRVGSLSFRDQTETKAHLAGKIRARYNRDHPGGQATRVRFVYCTWPRTREQYAPESDEDVTRAVVYSD